MDLIDEAREWVKDCSWADIEEEEDVDDMSDDEIRAGVNRYYAGGWDQFVADAS
jgi:hypothetical protein